MLPEIWIGAWCSVSRLQRRLCLKEGGSQRHPLLQLGVLLLSPYCPGVCVHIGNSNNNSNKLVSALAPTWLGDDLWRRSCQPAPRYTHHGPLGQWITSLLPENLHWGPIQLPLITCSLLGEGWKWVEWDSISLRVPLGLLSSEISAGAQLFLPIPFVKRKWDGGTEEKGLVTFLHWSLTPHHLSHHSRVWAESSARNEDLPSGKKKSGMRCDV